VNPIREIIDKIDGEVAYNLFKKMCVSESKIEQFYKSMDDMLRAMSITRNIRIVIRRNLRQLL
jgi:predicted nucleic acid-binding protein